MVMEKNLNLWFGLFVYLLGSSYMLCVRSYIVEYLTEYMKLSIKCFSFIEVVSKMEDLLSQCSANAEESLNSG